VIHWLLPSGSAVRPSSDAATLSRTQGRWRRMREKKPMLSSRAASDIAPSTTSTRMPAARSRCTPAPLTSGLGSMANTTTRATCAAMSASQHGGVRPWCAQGSSETHAVPPASDAPDACAARSAITSACASPARCVAPSPTARPCASASTQPTRGLGSERPIAL
jgi:hypothetical protein